MKQNYSAEEINSLYDSLLDGYNPSNVIKTEWEMHDGMFLQYSIYENNESCLSGTSGSIIATVL